jgi:hypothetical protein
VDDTTEKTPAAAPAQLVNVKDEDFLTLYANNVQVEASVWDLKVIFGNLDQSKQPNQIMQHTAIHLPWIQIKILSYFLPLVVALQEHQFGKIDVPMAVRPPDPAEFKSELWLQAWNNMSPAQREEISVMYKIFISSLPR